MDVNGLFSNGMGLVAGGSALLAGCSCIGPGCCASFWCSAEPGCVVLPELRLWAQEWGRHSAPNMLHSTTEWVVRDLECAEKPSSNWNNWTWILNPRALRGKMIHDWKVTPALGISTGNLMIEHIWVSPKHGYAPSMSILTSVWTNWSWKHVGFEQTQKLYFWFPLPPLSTHLDPENHQVFAENK